MSVFFVYHIVSYRYHIISYRIASYVYIAKDVVGRCCILNTSQGTYAYMDSDATEVSCCLWVSCSKCPGRYIYDALL